MLEQIMEPETQTLLVIHFLMLVPSKDFATPEKFLATNVCRSSPAQIGCMPMLMPRLTAAPRAINRNLLIAVAVNFPVLYPETVI